MRGRGCNEVGGRWRRRRIKEWVEATWSVITLEIGVVGGNSYPFKAHRR